MTARKRVSRKKKSQRVWYAGRLGHPIPHRPEGQRLPVQEFDESVRDLPSALFGFGGRVGLVPVLEVDEADFAIT
jgi:hypothetical protein